MSKRCTAFNDKYSNIPDDILPKLKSLDPTGNKCIYLNYIYRQYSEGKLTPNDFDIFKYYLELFEDNKSHIKNNDIQKYDLSSLRELFTVRLSDDVILDDAKVLYDGPYGMLSVPLTISASCKLGSGTKWCTASKENNLFESYNEKGPLYIWYDKNWNKDKLRQFGNKSKKFQFLLENAEYRYENDDRIDRDIMDYFIIEHPVLSVLFDRYEDSIKDDDTKISKFAFSLDPDDSIGYLTRHILDNDKRELNYINVLLDDTEEDYVKPNIYPITRKIFDRHLHDRNILPKIVYLDREYYKYIEDDPDLLYAYASLTNKRIDDEDMERQILSNPKYTYDYLQIMRILPKPDNIVSDNIVIRALVNREKNIDIVELNKIDHRYAEYYATHVVRSRCKLIESEDIMKDTYPYKYTDYYKLFIGLSNVNIEYGKEAEYLKNNYLNIDAYIEYYGKYGRSDIIERYMIEHEYYYQLTHLSLYYYNAPLKYLFGHIEPNIEEKVSEQIGLDDMYMYVFYNIGIAKNMDYILRKMVIYGESKELYDELCNMSNASIYKLNDTKSFGEITTDALKYIVKNAKYLYLIALASAYLGVEVKTPELFSTLNNKSSITDLVSYQIYWKKILNGIRMPIFEDISNNQIYLDGYKGRIDRYENMTNIPEEYLKTRVRK